MKVSLHFGAAACAAVVVACATTGGNIPSIGKMLAEETGQNGRACVRLDDIRGYGVLDDKVLSIDSSKDYYLATVLPGCNDLQVSMRTLFSGKFGEICGKTGRVATQGDHCAVNEMFEFETREQAFAAYNAVVEKRKALQQALQAD